MFQIKTESIFHRFENDIRRLDEKKALATLDRVMEKWTAKYPNSMKRWKDNWDAISHPKFSRAVRKVIYTTNAIESLNSTYRKLNRQRSFQIQPFKSPLIWLPLKLQKWTANNPELGSGLWRVKYHV